MLERTANCAVHLRHATQTVGVLDARIILEMRLPNLASIQKRQQMFGDGFLAGMRPGVLQTCIERRRSALERLKAHRAGNVRDTREPIRAEKREPADSVHRLCAI